MGDAGVAFIGNSNVTAGTFDNATEFVPNTGHDRLVTIENRLSSALYVVPAFQSNSPGANFGISVPPLTIGTVPIDPDNGFMILTNLKRPQTWDGSVFRARGSELRNCPYICHSDGGVGFTELYPEYSWIPAALSTPGSVITEQYVPTTDPSGIGQSGVQLADQCPQDTCIVAVSLIKSAAFSASSGGVAVYARYALGSNLENNELLLSDSDAIGTIATMRLRGAISVALVNGVGASTPIIGTAWLGIPPS